jgi:hypothetical protein
VWSVDELRGFFGQVHEDRMYAMWVMFTTTACRRCEIIGLHWDDLDLKAGASTFVVRSIARPSPADRAAPLGGPGMAGGISRSSHPSAAKASSCSPFRSVLGEQIPEGQKGSPLRNLVQRFTAIRTPWRRTAAFA